MAARIRTETVTAPATPVRVLATSFSRAHEQEDEQAGEGCDE